MSCPRTGSTLPNGTALRAINHVSHRPDAYKDTNKATAATWNVDNELENVVDTLKKKGVSFEHYDMPGVTRHGDLHETGNSRAAWFKDPDGNILALVGR